MTGPEPAPLHALARFLVSLDEPEGTGARRTVNLADICARARAAIAAAETPADRRAQIELEAERDGVALWRRLLGECGPCSCPATSYTDGEDARCVPGCRLCVDLPEGWPCPAWSGAGYGPGAAAGDPAPAEQLAEFDLRAALGLIERWCYGIARKAEVQGHGALAVTAPIIGQEIGRVLAGHAPAYAGGDDPDTVELGAFLSAQSTTRRHGLPASAVGSPLDRAARWAHELADAERAIEASAGADPAIEPGTTVARQVEVALSFMEDRGAERGRDEGAAWQAERITPDLLARALFTTDARLAVDPETAGRIRARLAAELGWPT